MFMCSQMLEQYEDSQLAYTMMPENRLSHPARDIYMLKFSSKAALQAFLDRSSAQHQNYVLTKVGKKGNDKVFEPARAKDLLLLVGSSKG